MCAACDPASSDDVTAHGPRSAGPVDPALIDDLVCAYRILANEGVLDSFGHVSVRHPGRPDRYLLARSIAPGTVTPADIMEFDLDSVPVDARGRGIYMERFIHGEIYKVRPDVTAVVHSHSPTVIPFGVTTTPLRAIFHNASFLGAGAPVFEIREAAGERNNMLVDNGRLGAALAHSLGSAPVALMRGHGDVVVGPNLEVAAFRAIYTEVNARLQIQASILGGPINFLNEYEAAKPQVTSRPWAFWKQKVADAASKER
jgi:HCOMODA/2-hydroxy-3-carboxy-muconic semialdehyde decarboxylase